MLLIMLAGGVLGSVAAGAQPYPTKPVRIVSPFAPGGGTDFIARLLAPKLAQSLGQQVIVDNRPGAGGTIGTELALKSPPDGYTFLVISAGYCVNPNFYRMRFDPVEDMTALAQVAKGPLLISAHPSLPARSIKDLVALARSRPRELNYSTSGTGSMGHMTGELLGYLAKVQLTHIPYKGTGPALTDAIAGHTHLNISGITTAMPHVKARRLKALAVTTSHRVAEEPQIPTVAESGVPRFEVTSWQGLLAPKNLPRAIVERVHGDVMRAIRQNDVVDVLRSNGVAPAGGSPEDFVREIRRELEQWRTVAANAGIAKP